MRKIRRWILIPSVVPPQRPPQERIICLLLSTSPPGSRQTWNLSQMAQMAVEQKNLGSGKIVTFPYMKVYFLDNTQAFSGMKLAES